MPAHDALHLCKHLLTRCTHCSAAQGLYTCLIMQGTRGTGSACQAPWHLSGGPVTAVGRHLALAQQQHVCIVSQTQGTPAASHHPHDPNQPRPWLISMVLQYSGSAARVQHGSSFADCGMCCLGTHTDLRRCRRSATQLVSATLGHIGIVQARPFQVCHCVFA